MIDRLYRIIDREELHYIEDKFPDKKLKGLQVDNVIFINTRCDMNTAERTCVLAEEIGHYYTNAIDALNQNEVINIKSEKRGRHWAYEELLPLPIIVKAFENGIKNRFELAEFANVTEEFVDAAIYYYRSKYGIYTEYEDYKICFEPCLSIYKNI